MIVAMAEARVIKVDEEDTKITFGARSLKGDEKGTIGVRTKQASLLSGIIKRKRYLRFKDR